MLEPRGACFVTHKQDLAMFSWSNKYRFHGLFYSWINSGLIILDAWSYHYRSICPDVSLAHNVW